MNTQLVAFAPAPSGRTTSFPEISARLWERRSAPEPLKDLAKDWGIANETSSPTPRLREHWGLVSNNNPVSGSSQSREDPIWLYPVAHRLHHLLQLQDGWDGPGTRGVNADVVVRTIRALVTIASAKTRPPSISPGRDGSVQLAWYTGDLDLEIDIPRSGPVMASLYVHASGRETELALTSLKLHAAMERLAADQV
jgi:hypothetical protein